MNLTEMLKKFRLFGELTENERIQIAKICNERIYEEGSVIFTMGGFAKDVYLLKSGKVNIQIEFKIYENEVKTTVYTVEKGEIFGWSALVPPHRLTASARCEKKSEVITINGKEFLELLEREKNMGYVVMKHLCGVISSRLAATTIALRHEIQRVTQK